MRIRNKLLLTMALPIGLLVIQVGAVNYFIRQLQQAAQFFGSAQTVIEADFAAADLVETLRDRVKRLPSSYNLSPGGDLGLDPLWQQISAELEVIATSEASRALESSVFETLDLASAEAGAELERTIAAAGLTSADLDTLLERAIFTDQALVALAASLEGLSVELRQQLQIAVDREREIHNRPLIAGIAIGGLAIFLLMLFAWLFVDRTIVRRLTALSDSMLAIAGGNLRAPLPSAAGGDEIGSMTQALAGFRDTAIEIEDNNLREIAAARQRLVEAIEATSEGFAFYDADDRLILCNTRYRELLYPDRPALIQPGMSFETILRRAAEEGYIRPEIGTVETSIQDRLARHRKPGDPFVQRRAGGRWIRISERLTTDGGTVAVYSDISELKQREVELADARDEAMAATQAKSQFLANMSPELRTPLNAIIGYSEMLHEEADDLGQDLFLADLEKIRDAGKHLLGLINDILDLSKIEAGKMTMLIETFEVETLLQEVEAVVAPLITRNDNRMAVLRDGDLGRMRSDQTKLRQNLFNLLSNAAKFTRNGRIELRVRRQERDQRDWLCFEVADSGIGMTGDQVERLFQAFSQADASTSRDYGGTGLGLAITRHFSEMLGGDIRVRSTQGEGSVFTMMLPTDHADAAAPPLPPAAPRSGSLGTVLVIDDDDAIREVLGDELAKEGYRVRHAAGGREGLRLARDQRPDLIALDIIMPDLDGWSVLKELKSDPELRKVPVVMMTIMADREMGYALGAADYLTKPFDREALVQSVNRLCAGAGAAEILVADDDQKTRELLRRTLGKAGYRIAEAENGRDALAALEHLIPAIILLDLMMPEMDGFALLEHLRHVPAWQEIPVVVVTAKDLSPEDLDWLNGNVLKVFEKGAYDRRKLVATVNRMVRHHVTAPAGEP
jgi:signal transduction histidine kinase/CheY-like chemotaxis protein/HAMP domain-containing protein